MAAINGVTVGDKGNRLENDTERRHYLELTVN